MKLENQLKRYFGYSTFRPLQKEIVASILEGRDTFALLPTGAGKSICFQLPALLLPGITIVVSPLIALMQDQVENLIKKSVSATYISSTLSSDEAESRLELIKLHKYKVIYVAPERLANRKFLRVCKSIDISLVVVDEAHCIDMWGHDFRPSYLQISTFVAQCSKRPPIAAFTATATIQTIAAITSTLKLHNPQVFRQSFLRSNLSIQVKHTEQYQLQEILVLFLLQKHTGQSGIIYTATHEAAEYLTQYIEKHTVSLKTTAAYYHGGLKASQRTYIQKLFLAEKIKIIIATSAFGMGIDKPNIRFVIHYNFPGSIEAYYQEIGRGGRDGELATCYLLYNPRNTAIHEYLATQSPDTQERLRSIRLLERMKDYCTSKKCRMQDLLNYFNEKNTHACGHCDICSPATIFTKQQQTAISRLEKTRKILQKQEHVSHVAEVLSDMQLFQLILTNPQSETDFSRLTGFGMGWKKRWLTHFLPIDGKIQIDTYQGKSA